MLETNMQTHYLMCRKSINKSGLGKRTIQASIAIAMFFLIFSSAQGQTIDCYYPGQTYDFSTPAAPAGEVWIYKWTAFTKSVPILDLSGGFDTDSENAVKWTVPLNPQITEDTIVTISVTVSKVIDTPWETTVTCIDMDSKDITVCPLSSITVVKDSIPDDPQDFLFSGDGSIGDFTLDDDGGSDPTYLNSQTFILLPDTSYSMTEKVELGWMLTAVTCTDGDGNSIPITLDKTLPAFGETEVRATIDAQYVTSGSSLTIVFENTKTAASIDIEKSTNDQDADTAPGPIVAEGSTVTWKYVVTNTGNVELTNVVVVDDQGVALGEPEKALPTTTFLRLAKPGHMRLLEQPSAASMPTRLRFQRISQWVILYQIAIQAITLAPAAILISRSTQMKRTQMQNLDP